MKNCPNCNRIVTDETGYCPDCGTQIPVSPIMDTASVPQSPVYGEQTVSYAPNYVPHGAPVNGVGAPQQPYAQPYVQPQTPLEAHRANGRVMAPNMAMPAPSMSFHSFYKWYLMIVGGLSGISAIVSLLTSREGYSIVPLGMAVLSFLAGLFLYQNKKAGFVMQKVRNIINIVGYSFTAIMSLICIFGGGAIAAVLDEIGAIAGGAFIIIGIILLLIAAGGIVVDALVLKYYEKRKYIFQN